MGLEIFPEIEQRTDEWFEARLGIPTASQFSKIIAKGRSGGESLQRLKYMRELAGERITGKPAESYSNGYTERGRKVEEEARCYYELINDVDVECIGFVRNCIDGHYYGCSPDGLVGKHGLLEIKTAKPDILIEIIEKKKVPSEHMAQIQGQIWVCQRDWCDFFAYYPGMPPFIKRVERDDEYIARLADAVASFNRELAKLVERIRP
jgi:predicted phage-related endonuclease